MDSFLTSLKKRQTSSADKFTAGIIFQMRLENMEAGRKGNLNIATEVRRGWNITVIRRKICTHKY